MKVLQRLFNASRLPAALPKVIHEESQHLRDLFVKTFPNSVPLFIPSKPQVWAEALSDSFTKVTSHKLFVQNNPRGIPESACAIAQRMPSTNNTRISYALPVQLYDMAHEFVHALQNTFKSLQEPLICDGSGNAIGKIMFEDRSILGQMHQFFFKLRAARPNSAWENTLLHQFKDYWQKLTINERQQCLMYYMQEYQAQSIPLAPLAQVLPAAVLDAERAQFHQLARFLKQMINVESELKTACKPLVTCRLTRWQGDHLLKKKA